MGSVVRQRRGERKSRAIVDRNYRELIEHAVASHNNGLVSGAAPFVREQRRSRIVRRCYRCRGNPVCRVVLHFRPRNGPQTRTTRTCRDRGRQFSSNYCGQDQNSPHYRPLVVYILCLLRAGIRAPPRTDFRRDNRGPVCFSSVAFRQEHLLFHLRHFLRAGR